MASRETIYHITGTPDEKAAIDAAAASLSFDRPAVAIRTLALAVGGDKGALARVAPFLRSFRQQLEALERGQG